MALTTTDKAEKYGYIEIFIKYLKEIIDMIIELFSKINLGGNDDGAADGDGEGGTPDDATP